jgi:flagellar motor switch protein FliM
MGEKFGRDNIWEGHLATELWTTDTEVRAVLDEQSVPLSKVLNLKVGETLMLNATPDTDVSLRCGPIPVTTGRMGRKGQHIAIRVDAPISLEAANRLTRGGR